MAGIGGAAWRRAHFKGQTVWARIVAEDDQTLYISPSDKKACIRYKDNASAKWYFCTAELVVLMSDDEIAQEEGGMAFRPRRRKRGAEPTEEEKAAEEAEKKRPRHADNGKLYGIVKGSEKRVQYVRGKDFKKKCNKCADKDLDSEDYIGFIEASRQKTVSRTYGEGRNWSATSGWRERNFFCYECWAVPKTAQRSLRGFIDIDGFDDLAPSDQDKWKKKLPLVYTEDD